MQDELQQFFRYLETEKRYSPHTLSSYRRDIRAFQSYCQDNALQDWQQIDQGHIRQHIARLHRQGQSGKSIQRHLSSLRSLFRFLLRQQKVDSNPAQGVTAPKAERKLPEVLNPDQLNRLLSIPATDPVALRDRAIMELLYGCGLRMAELVGLDLQDIRHGEASLQVTGKGSKQRQLPLGGAALRALEDWLKVRSQLAQVEETAVFVGTRGQRISPASVRLRLKYWAQRQGVQQNIYPHLMRHSFASHILESSQNLRAVQELLGHANLSTTQIYTHLDFQHLAQVYDAAHPRAKADKK